MEVAYAAFGRDFVYQAAISANSVKRHMPDVSTLLVTDVADATRWFDRTVVVDLGDSEASPKQAKIHKLTAIERAQSDAVLYLDADTYLVADLRQLQREIVGWDIALAHDTWQRPEVYRSLNGGLPKATPPASHPYYNGGVMFVWKSGRAMRVLREWMGDYAADARIRLDQLLLREKLYAALDVRTLVLPSTYNCRAGEPVFLSGQLQIIHRGIFAGGHEWQHSHAFLADFLNSTTANRIYSPLERTMTVLHSDFRQEVLRLDDHQATVEKPEYLLVD